MRPGPLLALRAFVARKENRWLFVCFENRASPYDGAERLKSIYSATRRWLDRVTTKSESGALLMDNAYSRAATGRIYAAAGLKVVAGLNVDDSWSYNYDELDRLTYAYNPGDSTLTEAFTYDLADNMLSRTRMPGAYVYPAHRRPPAHAAVCRRPRLHL